MRVLIDQNIPISVARLLAEFGHEVRHVRDVLDAASPDALIAYVAAQEGYVIVTHDDDFRRIEQQVPGGLKRRVRQTAGRIIVGPTGPDAARRLREVHDLLVVMYEWAERHGRQYRVDITNISVRLVDLPVRPAARGQ